MKPWSTKLGGWLKGAKDLGIRARLISAFIGIASLTLLASIVGFFSYIYIGRNLDRIETEGVQVMHRALIFARQAAEYSMIASALRAADDKTVLLGIVKDLTAKQIEMNATLETMPKLRYSARTFMEGIDEVAEAVDLRLSSSARRNMMVEQAIAAHARIMMRLTPLLDDADFDLATGLEELTGVEPSKMMPGVLRAQLIATAFQRLADASAEGHIALGILMEASLTSDVALLVPLKERFAASSDRARKALAWEDGSTGPGKVRPDFEAFLSLVGGPGGIFQARANELAAIAASQRAVATNQADAAMLTSLVQDAVKTAEDATAGSVGAARTAIMQSQRLLILLTVGSLASAVIFAWIYVGRGLLTRLSKLNDAILALAGGNLDVEIPHEGHDELTRIADAVEVFKCNALAARELEADKEIGRMADLEQREVSFRLLFEGNPVPMWVYERKSLQFLAVNDAAVTLYGYSREQFLAMTVLDVRPDNARDAIAKFLERCGGNSLGKEIWEHRKADGTVFEINGYARALTYYGFEAALVAIIDITERKLAEARLAHMAHHDPLTNLPNRTLFRQRLGEALERCKKGVAVLTLDLDGFKEVNDTLGHPIGDALLRVVGRRLRGCVRETDTIARVGGDEFAIVQCILDDKRETAALAQRILTAINAPFDLYGHEVTIGTSIGIAVSPEDAVQAEQLLQHAGLALFRAKTERLGAFHFFEPEMDRLMQERRSLEQDLRNAMINREFAVHYQPLVSVERNAICGFEALLRWTHPIRGKVSPADFIPLAEETGLIVPIGEWVLRQACKDAGTWPKHIKVAVNVSVAQFKSRHLVDLVLKTLAETGMAPQRLELEITESVMLEDKRGTMDILTRLHDHGVRMALDDFGTGYSSLSTLRKFPFNKIKIDQSFVSELSAANVDALAVVRSIAQLGVSLGMSTIAEGVETEEQMRLVKAEGCTEMQGYFFSRAVPAEEVAALLLADQHKPGVASPEPLAGRGLLAK